MDDLQTCICVNTYMWLEVNLVISHIPLGTPETTLRKQVCKVQEKNTDIPLPQKLGCNVRATTAVETQKQT